LHKLANEREKHRREAKHLKNSRKVISAKHLKKSRKVISAQVKHKLERLELKLANTCTTKLIFVLVIFKQWKQKLTRTSAAKKARRNNK